MARPKSKQPEIMDLNEDVIKVDEAIVRPALLEAREQEKHDILELGQLLGRLESAEFFAKIANVALIGIFEKIKKSKAWKSLKNPSCQNRNFFSSLDEFCEVKLGKSYRRLQEMSLNMRALGEEAYEQAEKLGLRQVGDFIEVIILPHVTP